MKENYHNSRSIDEIDMKFGSVTTRNKRNKVTSKKKLTMRSCQQIVTSLSFLLFMVNLEPSKSRIPDFIQKMKTELKNLWHYSCDTIALSKGTIFAQKSEFLQKILISAKLRRRWYVTILVISWNCFFVLFYVLCWFVLAF